MITGKQGFRRSERLLTSAQFKHVYAARSLVKSAWIWIYRAPNRLTHNRVGISVSNRICPHLVARNRVKRIIREIFRQHKEMFGQGIDVVFVLKAYPPRPALEPIERHIFSLIKAS